MLDLIMQSFKMAVISMKANLGRSALTVLGVVIGIASVIIVFSAGEGVRGLVLGMVESFGSDFIEIEIKIPTGKKGAASEQQSGAAIAQGVQVTTLKLEDLDDIAKIPNVENIYGAIMSQDQLSYENESRKASLLGVTAGYIDIDRSEVEFGQFFTEAEDKSLAQVIVLGSKIKDKLFGDSDAIGRSVRLRKTKFTVIGVMKERGAAAFMDFDDYAYVPLRTLQKKIMGIDHMLYSVATLKDTGLAADTAEEMKAVLRDNHNISDPLKDDFRVVTMDEMMDTMDTITNALTYLLLAIVAISLLVGGVGIMNVMYVIVTERTAEIGLRKAVGAKYKDIMWQFLVEAVMVAMVGAVIGIVIGIGLSAFVAYLANSFGLAWKFIIPFKAFVVSIGFATFFGILFGVYPARKAARMSPMEALRTE